jgi:hypothetical protein
VPIQFPEHESNRRCGKESYPEGDGKAAPEDTDRRCGRGCRLAAMLVALVPVAGLGGDRGGRSALGLIPQRAVAVALDEFGA